MLLKGFHGILRTGGRETARGRRQRADKALIEADGKDEDLSEHLCSLFTFLSRGLRFCNPMKEVLHLAMYEF